MRTLFVFSAVSAAALVGLAVRAEQAPARWIALGSYAGPVQVKSTISLNAKDTQCEIRVTSPASGIAQFDLHWAADAHRGDNSFRFVFADGQGAAFDFQMLQPDGKYSRVAPGLCSPDGLCQADFKVDGVAGKSLNTHLKVQFHGTRLDVEMSSVLSVFRESFLFSADRR